MTSEAIKELKHEELAEAYVTLHEEFVSFRDESSEKIASLEHELKWFKRQIFGRKSEKLPPPLKEQLFLGDFSAVENPAPPKTRVKEHERRESGSALEFAEDSSRLKFDSSVPVRECRVPNVFVRGLPEDQYQRIGEEVCYKLSQDKGPYVVLKYIRPKVKLKDSGKIITAPVTQASTVIEGSIAEVSFLVGVILDKYLYHLPLYRQHQRLKAFGIHLNRMTLTNLIHTCGELLKPIAQALEHSVLDSAVLSMDETPVKAGRNENGRQMKKTYFWAMYGDREEVVFLHSASRAGEVVREALEGFQGTLLTDGYKVYEKFAEAREEVIRAQCWSHVRRKFFEAQEAEPELSGHALRAIGALYNVEKEHGAAARRVHAAPIVDELFGWLRESLETQALLPHSPFHNAASYALSNERALRVFLDEPKVQLDTNHLERQLRPNAVGRKNYLFHWTEVGAQHAAVFYSLIATCRLHEVDPREYLIDVLQRIESHPHNQIHLLIPRLWKENFYEQLMLSDLDAQFFE